jgi:hypothetical protein
MARRILNRKDLRADYDAAERRKQEDGELDETETDEDEGEEEKDEAEDETEDEAEEVEEPVKKKAPAKAAKPRSRTRTPKVVRMKVVWGVFNNSNQRVAVFDYPRRQEAEDLAAKLRGDKRTAHFVQAIKEPMEEKKE